MGEHLLILFGVITGAAVIPFFARNLRIPSATLEILYGILLFNAIYPEKPDWFAFMQELGLIYLMFMAGMELHIRDIVKGRRFVWYILTPLLSLLIMPVIFDRIGYPFYLGIAVAMVSAGIIIPVLKEAGLVKTGLGRDIIGIALTGELISILFLTGIDIYHTYTSPLTALFQGTKLLFLMLLAALFLRVLYVTAWWNPEKVRMVMESEDPVEEGIRAVIFILIFGAILAYSAGVEPILGSFMAGVIFSLVFRSKGRFEEKINAVGFGFFTPFFFIGIGADFDLTLLSSPEKLSLSIFLTAMLFSSNIFPLLFSRFMKLKMIEALGISLILSAPLSLLIVAGAIGVNMGLIDKEMNDLLILTALISSILFPFLFRLAAKRFREQTCSA